MAKVICLFNHKGGVSKTTSAFHLGWTLGTMGKKVLLADFDPQCNLTGLILGYRGVDDLEATLRSDPPNNIKDGLSPAFEAKPRQIGPVECVEVPGVQNVHLLQGHIGLSEYETTLGIAQELSGALLPLRNVPGSIRYLINETAAAYGIDYVLVDMSPSLGPLNQNLLTTSDYFLVPLHPDYFSSMALTSLARILPKWQQWATTAYSVETLKTADYPFPKPHVQFAGTLVQKYRPRLGKASAAFERWIEQLRTGTEKVLVPALTAAGMLDVDRFSALAGQQPWQPLLDVGDFNSLIALSQEHHVPVFGLNAEMIDRRGAVWAQHEEDMGRFRAAFVALAEKIIAITA